MFNCTLTPANSSASSFQWLRGSTKIYPDNRKDTSNWSSFELKNLTAQDEGTYQCVNGGTDSLIVRLASKPSAVHIYNFPLFPAVDEDATFKCEAEGWPKPRITWMKNNKNISEINQNHEYKEKPIPSQGGSLSSVASELTIFGIQVDDSGTYTCLATNAVGTEKYDLKVTVQAGPEKRKMTMTADKPKYTVQVGGDVVLACRGDEVMEDDFTWVHWELNGTKLNLTSTDHYEYATKYSNQYPGEATPKVLMNLTIFDVDYADEGNYTCVVHTNNDYESDNIVLEVKAREKRRKGMEVWMIVVIAVASFLMALSLVVFIIVKCRQIKRKRKMAKVAQKYERGANDYTFENDVFVSYSSKDYDWIVQSLLPVFDNNNVKYIIHSRDFKPGKAFFDNMADSVYNSRKVVLVVSANYLSSGFCKDEMHMALYRSAERDDGSLIVVRIDNIKTTDIPRSVRHKTFIDFTSREEEATWENRILEAVRSENRSWSVTSDESTDGAGAWDKIQLINPFKLKKNRKQNVQKELTDQIC